MFVVDIVQQKLHPWMFTLTCAEGFVAALKYLFRYLKGLATFIVI